MVEVTWFDRTGSASYHKLIERRRFLVSSLGGVFVPLAGEAQQASGRARVAVFFAGFPQSYGSERTWDPTLVSALRNLGWVEGHNLTLEWRYSEDQEEQRRALAEDFVRRKLDVIVVQSTTGTVEMKRATATIPIVMVLIGDPIGAGLVQSLARPGGNITGTSLMTSETSAKGLQFLKELLPTARRVTVPAGWRPLHTAGCVNGSISFAPTVSWPRSH